jgi:pentose-5-phosphate-3-epimerase
MGWNEWIRTVEIAPSLTSAEPAAVAGQVDVLLRSGCRIFHVDDHLDLLERIAPLVRRHHGVVDVHLSDPLAVAAAIVLGADSVTVDELTQQVVDELRAADRQVGALFAGTPVPDVDLVSIPVDGTETSVARVREVTAGLGPGVRVQVVGDIGHDSVRAFRDAGATVIVVGLSIFEREDLPRAYRRLVQALA